MRTLVTGATGFVGTRLLRHLLAQPGIEAVAACRAAHSALPDGVQVHAGLELSTDTDWSSALRGVDVIVHLAARVHVMRDAAPDPIVEFRRVNVDGTSRLARDAAAAGVRRLVFVSSIKVNGESTGPCKPFRAGDTPEPVDAYGVSKHEAERALRDVAAASGLELVIIRPPLVYGPGVRANFHSMMRWLWRGRPLPLGAIDNRRSLIGLDNLVDVIATCMHHPNAANETFLVSDGEDLSTPSLLQRTAAALGVRARLLPVPGVVLQGLAALAGKAEIAQRLLGSLQVDISATCDLLGWSPPFGVDEQLKRTAEHFLASRPHR